MEERKSLRGLGAVQSLAGVGLVLLLLSLALMPGVDVVAQDDGPTPEERVPSGPPRLLERGAPTREPEIVERGVTPQGRTNTITVLPAEADTYIASEWPNQNFGSDALYLGYNLGGENSFGAERILIRFDVIGNVPAGAVVNDARLQLYLNFASPADDAPMGTFLRRLASDWTETGVTWNTEPTWAEVRVDKEVESAIGWYEWEITGLVSDWVALTHPNYGMEIIGDEQVQQRERAFYSREVSNDLYPRLVVDYTDFNDTQPPDVSVDALPALVDRDFEVSWSGTDPGGSGIASYDVQYRVDGGAWADWLVDVTFSAADFVAGADGGFYEFRARGEDRAGNVEPFDDPEASTTVDAQPPTTVVDPLPAITSSTAFSVSWTGSDVGSGIDYYDVRYRFNGGDWLLWQDQTLASSTTFNAMGGDGLYEFEARAVDNLGLVEDFTGEPEASIIVDAVAPFVEPQLWLPLIFHNFAAVEVDAWGSIDRQR